MKVTNLRLPALDGLRGLAAVVVVGHHALLTIGQLAAPYFGIEPEGRLATALVYSPLHLAWAGTEAVFLFFVISGFVLAKSVAAFSADWQSYYVSRLVRLLVPVWAAVVLAWLTFAVFPREATGTSLWLQVSPRSYTPPMMARDAMLIEGTSGAVTPMWSLTWEVFFSLLLPVFLFAAVRLRAGLLVPASIAVSVVGVRLGNGALTYLPIFAIGVALAVSARWLEEFTHLVDTGSKARRWLVGAGLTAIVLALAMTNWWAPGLRGASVVGLGAHALSLVGVAGIVMLAIAWRPMKALLESTVMRWLGAVSFSLYLVHEPIIKGFAFWLPGSRLGLLASVGVSFAVAWLFHRLIEAPTHSLARRLRSREHAPQPAS